MRRPRPRAMSSLTKDAGFEGLAETYGVGDEDPLAGPREGETSRVELIGDEIHGGGVPDVNLRVVRHGL